MGRLGSIARIVVECGYPEEYFWADVKLVIMFAACVVAGWDVCPAETLSKGPRPGNGVPAGSEEDTKFRATAAYAALASASSSNADGAYFLLCSKRALPEGGTSSFSIDPYNAQPSVSATALILERHCGLSLNRNATADAP